MLNFSDPELEFSQPYQEVRERKTKAKVLLPGGDDRGAMQGGGKGRGAEGAPAAQAGVRKTHPPIPLPPQQRELLAILSQNVVLDGKARNENLP